MKVSLPTPSGSPNTTGHFSPRVVTFRAPIRSESSAVCWQVNCLPGGLCPEAGRTLQGGMRRGWGVIPRAWSSHRTQCQRHDTFSGHLVTHMERSHYPTQKGIEGGLGPRRPRSFPGLQKTCSPWALDSPTSPLSPSVPSWTWKWLLLSTGHSTGLVDIRVL